MHHTPEPGRLGRDRTAHLVARFPDQRTVIAKMKTLIGSVELRIKERSAPEFALQIANILHHRQKSQRSSALN